MKITSCSMSSDCFAASGVMAYSLLQLSLLQACWQVIFDENTADHKSGYDSVKRRRIPSKKAKKQRKLAKHFWGLNCAVSFTILLQTCSLHNSRVKLKIFYSWAQNVLTTLILPSFVYKWMEICHVIFSSARISLLIVNSCNPTGPAIWFF